MSINWPAFAEIVRSHHSFLLTSHIRPDCDALGSELGMAGVLDALGKNVRIVNGHPTPPNLAFIDPGRRIEVIGEQVQFEDLADIDLMMILDTSSWAQLGPMGDVVRGTSARKVVFDHHVIGDDVGAELFKDTTSDSTGRLVAEAAGHLEVELTPEIAAPLFAAVATDTGWFRFGSCTAATYRCAANLVEAGASPPQIYGALFEQDTLGRVRLRGRILERIQGELEGRLFHTHVLLSDFEDLGALPSDTEDAVNNLLGIKGAEFALIFVQLSGGAYKISFRSRCEADCSQLAAQFGGGGHKAAAGATVQGELDDIRAGVLAAVRQAMA